MKQSHEVEAKFRIPSANIFTDLLALRELSTFHLVPAAHPEQQYNTYYDTTQRHLRNARHGFRIRRVGQQISATLKGPAHNIGNAQRRAELEIALPNADPTAIPAGELHLQLQKLTNRQPLQAIVSIDTNRQIINAFRNQQHVLELALDTFTIHAAAQHQTSHELELEMVAAGTTADLEALIELLVPRYQLIAEPLSKLARGLLLLGENEQ
jgi:inorganic triphosphatase YgiF